MKLCLNCIVKNESARIERMLDSVCQFIDYWVIVDTGSTDDTKEKIAKYFEHHKVPGSLYEAPFHDWAQARNAALAYARVEWCKNTSLFDYLLLVDADMELKVGDRSVFDRLGGPSYDMMQHAGSCHYLNRRLLAADHTGKYLGVTHEYLDVPSAAEIKESEAFFIDHADGANRPEKFRRDIRLLKRGLREEPNNERYMFYLANSYRDAGEYTQAIPWYKKRVAAGGWDEEVWQAQVFMAHCYYQQGNEGEFIRNALLAYNMRPKRAEPLHDLAHHFRMKGMNAPAALFAEVGMTIPPPAGDSLFINDRTYKGALKEEFSISGFYVPGKRQRAFEVTDSMLLFPGPYGDMYHTARNNMYHYLPPLSALCPSFTWKNIGFKPPEGWTAMNPSVTLCGNELWCIIRTVNYTITENGRYLIKEVMDDGTTGCNANAEFPINTRNWLARLTDRLTVWEVGEVLPPGNFPKEWSLVVGFEDMRLFPYLKTLCFSATCRQLHADGNCEQVRGRLEPIGGRDWKVDEGYVRMLRTPRQTEKNWAPVPPVIDDAGLQFIYRPGEVVDAFGQTVAKYPTPFNVGSISGGSQLVEFGGAYIALVHEAAYTPFEPVKRYYWHRFIVYGNDLQPLKISTPFVFNDRQIEFAAGMCWHPDGERLVISYGVKDAEARIATVATKEIKELLCLG